MELGYSDKLNTFNKRAYATPNLINVAQCDPPRYGFRPDPAIFEFLSGTDYEKGYPDASLDLVSGIVQRTKEFTGISVKDDDVIISNGLGGAFAFLSIALAGKSMGLQTPFYGPLYEYMRKTSDIWYARCTPELEWAIDCDMLRQELEKRKKPGYIVLVSPSNPTGDVHSRKSIQEIVNLAGEFDQIIITDEVYDEMSFVPYTSILSHSRDIPVIYMHGFSKVWRAPEIRIGFTILHDPEGNAHADFQEIRRIAKLGFGVNLHSQRLAALLLKEDRTYRKEQFNEIERRSKYLTDLVENSDNLQTVAAKGATYQYVRIPGNDWKTAYRLLERDSILTTPGSAFDPFIGDNYLRIVFLNTPECLEKFVSSLDKLEES
ncbi:MAG: pyridoxal phosphate-dependent aminotransferase [Candidatus Thorarchaeota archaeon]